MRWPRSRPGAWKSRTQVDRKRPDLPPCPACGVRGEFVVDGFCTRCIRMNGARPTFRYELRDRSYPPELPPLNATLGRTEWYPPALDCPCGVAGCPGLTPDHPSPEETTMEYPPEVLAEMEAADQREAAARAVNEDALTELRRLAAARGGGETKPQWRVPTVADGTPPDGAVYVSHARPVLVFLNGEGRDQTTTILDRVAADTLWALGRRERAIMRALLTVALGTLDEADGVGA